MKSFVALATVLATVADMTNAAACTTDQASVIVETSMAAPWENCTSKVGSASSMMALIPTDAAKITHFCATPTCTTNLDAWIKSIPECTVDGVNQIETMTKMTISGVGSTTGGTCSPNQLITVGQLFVAPVPAACASATGIPPTTTLTGMLNLTTTVICDPSCFEAVTAAAAALPNCTVDGKLVNYNATFFVKLCTSSSPVSVGVALVTFVMAFVVALG